MTKNSMWLCNFFLNLTYLAKPLRRAPNPCGALSEWVKWIRPFRYFLTFYFFSTFWTLALQSSPFISFELTTYVGTYMHNLPKRLVWLLVSCLTIGNTNRSIFILGGCFAMSRQGDQTGRILAQCVTALDSYMTIAEAVHNFRLLYSMVKFTH
jgi:membrane protein required for beta-lactamase induction